MPDTLEQAVGVDALLRAQHHVHGVGLGVEVHEVGGGEEDFLAQALHSVVLIFH